MRPIFSEHPENGIVSERWSDDRESLLVEYLLEKRHQEMHLQELRLHDMVVHFRASAYIDDTDCLLSGDEALVQCVIPIVNGAPMLSAPLLIMKPPFGRKSEPIELSSEIIFVRREFRPGDPIDHLPLTRIQLRIEMLSHTIGGIMKEPFIKIGRCGLLARDISIGGISHESSLPYISQEGKKSTYICPGKGMICRILPK